MKTSKDSATELSRRTVKFLEGSGLRIKIPKPCRKMKNWEKAFLDLYAKEPFHRRQSLAFAYALENEETMIFPEEFLTGMIYADGIGSPDYGGSNGNRTVEEFDAACQATRKVSKCLPDFNSLIGSTGWHGNGSEKPSWIWSGGAAPGHIGWHWEWILEYGIEGLLVRIVEAEKDTDEKGREFLEGAEICLKSILNWNEKHIVEMKKMFKSEKNEEEILRLRKMIDICNRVPRKGAITFHEAVQSFYFGYLCTMYENPHGGNGPGRLDYHLWPYLERDLASGRTTLEEARQLIDECFIRLHERLGDGRDGWVETIVVGGTHPDGSSSVNPLTRIMVDSISSLKITHPSVYIRIPDQADVEIMELASSYIINGGNRAQILNDRAIVSALMASGMPENEARMYMCGGCMEISSQGTSGDYVFCGFFNVLKVLEYVLSGGNCLVTGERKFTQLGRGLSDYRDFDAFMKAFRSELKRTLMLVFKMIEVYREESSIHRPRFLVSSMIENCIERGRNMNDGGAKYNDYGFTPLGIPNVADCIIAIRKMVYEEKNIPAEELLRILKDNFKGAEDLRMRLLNCPKYGQGDAEADKMAGDIIRMICDISDEYRNAVRGKIKPMIMTFMMAPVAGRCVGASADGRMSEQPVAQGISPQNCAMTKGLTQAMVSATSIPLHRFAGGASNMWDIDHGSARIPTVKALLSSFFNLGGQMFQGNTTDVDELVKARKNPEQYPHLTVRVGGFSGRFVSLSDDNQQEVINRCRHKI